MARKRKPTDTVQLKLRLPEGLREALAGEAEKANRSLNSEILWRLGQTFGEEWQRFIAGVEQRERKEEEIIQRALQSPTLHQIIKELVAKSGKGEQ